ncbi:MAG: cupin domain-containing protein [Amaricoccus sp.]|uniref:cupin domain-containing protein n=1 Tax=Amaricoccus sp. TaxID=1872485 RepID=UPI0039E27DAA
MPPWLVPGPFPAEFMTDERCSITELLNIAESPDASLALARVSPGVTTRLHAVTGTVERYVILSGTGIVEIAGTSAPVAPGDRVLIPPGIPQRITATGDVPLEFHCLCTPRFRPENYVDLGDPVTPPSPRSPR